MGRNMNQEALNPITLPPKKFSVNEWQITHELSNRSCFDQQRYSDSILQESDRLTNMMLEKTKLLKAESNHQLKVRVEEISYHKGEMEKIRKEILLEIESLVVYIDRLEDARSSLGEAMTICKKCLVIRDSRTGIDLVHDEVQKTLLQELHVIRSVEEMLKHLHGQMGEQLRSLRAVLYTVDRNLEDKIHALKIDERAEALDISSLNLSIYHGRCPLDPANITFEEWINDLENTINTGLHKLASSRQMRLLMEALMKQATVDLITQRTLVNDAFYRNLAEVKEKKSFMEERHSDITRKCQDMMENIRKIQQTIKNQEPYMALSHTRLGNRAHRRNVELVRDHVETQLAYEALQLRNSVARLQQLLAESQASLRQLLRTQLGLEEQINVKTVSIKLDEVECLTIRQKMDYFHY